MDEDAQLEVVTDSCVASLDRVFDSGEQLQPGDKPNAESDDGVGCAWAEEG